MSFLDHHDLRLLVTGATAAASSRSRIPRYCEKRVCRSKPLPSPTAVLWATTMSSSGSTVMLWAIGGLTLHEPTSSRKKRVGIALMGPAFGLVLGAIFLGVQQLVPLEEGQAAGPPQYFVHIMVLINFLWTAVNLLPVYPLDGGQALLAGLEYKLAPARARRVVAVVSVVTAAGGLAAALAFGICTTAEQETVA